MLNRAVWVEINLDHLAHNMKEVRRVTNKASKITAVIKADGYGHGAVHIGQTLLDNGADRFAVATLTEALQLRKVFKTTEILILGYTTSESIHLAVNHHITQTVYTWEQAVSFNEIAMKQNKKLKVHIKIDTGMTRLGMQPDQATIDTIERMSKLEGLDIEGLYTHFARADEIDKSTSKMQIERFEFVRKGLVSQGVDIPICHVSNSAGIIDMPEYNYDMVRAGIMLYGLYPSDEVDHKKVDLKQVMSLHAKISRVQKVSKDVGVSYGHKYTTSKTQIISTLPIGYADGYSRSLTGKVQVLLKDANVKVPVVGRICMDQCMIDTTDVDVSIGDEVILMGYSDQWNVDIDYIASLLETINYEVVCMINKRVPRVYTKSGDVVKVIDYIMSL